MDNNEYGHLAATLSCIGDGIISTDIDGTLIYMNKAAEELTGWKTGEALNKKLNEILPIRDGETHNLIDSPVKLAIEDGYAIGLRSNSYFIDKSLAQKYISASCSPIKTSEGITTGAVIAFRDITRIRHAEEELKRAKEKAEVANKAKSEFLANMSHEIRTPLNGMIGMLDLTLKSKLTVDQRESLDIAKSCTTSLLKVINDILDFSKMEAGRLTIENIWFNIKDLIEDIVKVHTQRAKEKGLELFCNLSSDIPQGLIGDPSRLKQILNNLIGNAIKFTENGNVSVDIKRYSKVQGGLEILFSVSDTGIGIASDKLDLLFKSFSQVDSSYTRKFGGTGLGLVISKQLVEMMGGKIWVESDRNGGSIFYFTIKVEIGNKKDEIEPVLKSTPPICRSCKILLVEDDKVNQMVIDCFLKDKGHALSFANNGREAVTATENNDFDIILMDIQLPEMDGLEATAKIRERDKRLSKHTPIIALTAYSLKGDREKFLSYGMDEYIPKPVDIKVLLEIIERFGPKGGGTAADILHEVKTNGLGDEKKTVYDGIQINKIRDDLYKQLLALKQDFYDKNVKAIENTAHLIKITGNKIEEAGVIKQAFKIELATRRSDLFEVGENIIELEKEILKLRTI